MIAKEVAHEGFLRVRASTGFAGMRPWLMRYWVLCKSDLTLRRYHDIEDVEKGAWAAERSGRRPLCLCTAAPAC